MDRFKTWRVAALIGFLALIFGVGRLYYHLTDDFTIANISHALPYHPEWEIASLPSEERQVLDTIFDQKFTYLGKGAQAYALLSEDGEYVLKFFKSKHAKPSFFVNLLKPLSVFDDFREKHMSRKRIRLEKALDGYKLAYDEHKEGSGLVYIHLNKTENLNKTVVIQDKMGFSKELDLDSHVFVIQKKTDKTRNVVIKLLEQEDLSGVKIHLRKLIDLHLMEYKKGIYDRDHGVMHNTGFIDGTPIRLDVGKLSKEDKMRSPEYFHDDLMKMIARMKRYFQVSYPQYFSELNRDIDDKLTEVFGQMP